MESTAMIAEWHNPRQQQIETSPNTTSMDAETKKRKPTYLQKTSDMQEPAKRDTHIPTANP